MAKKTLGAVTKQILSDLDFDIVNNINETEESLQVARIVISTYEEMVTRLSLPVDRRLFQLEAALVAVPTLMAIPSSVTFVESVAYDTRHDSLDDPSFNDISRLDPDEFLRRVNGRRESDPHVESITLPSGVPILILNDRSPSYWTSFDNQNIVFDSYDSGVETNLQKSKTQCLGETETLVALEEEAEIHLDPQLFSLLENKARATAFVRLKQSRDPSSESTARRLEIKAQSNKWRQNGDFRYPGYGRHL